MTGRTMGENLARISFWTMAIGILLAFVPLFLAGSEQDQVVDAYKFFGSSGVDAYNLIASIGTLILAAGIVMTLVNAILSRVHGPEAGHDPWGGDSLEWFTLSPPQPHNFDVLPDVRSAQPMRDIRDAIAHRTGSTEAPARESQPVA
jgi:heme/copper-type cytochrome/quinol oxidase subunit 1